MDKHDNTSQGSSIDSVAGSWPSARTNPDVFDEVFGGPCWTESCPTPRDCFQSLVCATRYEPRVVVGPPTCSYRRPCVNVNPATTTIPVFAFRPPTPTIIRKFPSPKLMAPRAIHLRLSPSILPLPSRLPTIDDDESECKVIELKSPVYDTCDSNSYTSIDQLKIPAETECLGEICQYYPPDFRPASVTPTNLSPLPKSLAGSFSVCENEESPVHWSEFTASADDIALRQRFDLPPIGGMQRGWKSAPRLKHTSILPCNGFTDFRTPLPTPLPTPPPPCIMADEQEDSGEFVRPRIAALEPYCTCIKDDAILDIDIQTVPWVHTKDCKIIRAMYESRTSFYEEPPRELGYETMTANSLMQHMTDDMTARTCLRVTTQLNMQPVVHFFAQYTGFLGVHLTPGQDHAYVAYATDEQSNRARLGLEGLLVSQLQKIHITTVDKEQAMREMRGIRVPSFRVFLSSLLCCKNPQPN